MDISLIKKGERALLLKMEDAVIVRTSADCFKCYGNTHGVRL
jgi:hypothetical protein